MTRQFSWRDGASAARAMALAAAALAAALATGPARAEPVTLTIVHVNDLDRLDGSGGRGGVARLAAVVKEVRASAPHVLVTHGGDAISPSLLSSFDKGAHMIDLFNQVGFDAMVLGNHEFDFTPAVTVARIAEARFPILASNALEPDDTLIALSSCHGIEAEDWYAISLITFVEPREPFQRVARMLATVMSEDFGARLHWGKWFPLVAAAAVERNYPGMQVFKSACGEFDPRAVFRNRFLRETIFSR